MNEAVRLQLKGWLEKKREIDRKVDEEQLSDDVIRESYGLVDAELDKLLLALEPGVDDGAEDPDGEAKEILSLYEQAEPARYIHLAADGKALDGAEHELNAALNMSHSHTMPIGLLLPEYERDDRIDLADAVTAITTKTTVNTSPIAARVFKQRAVGVMGFQMPSVGSGTARYPFLTAGTTASVVARGAFPEAAAADIDVVDIDPVAMQATYILDRDTILQNGAEVRTLLETDTRMVFGEALDAEILLGDGASPTRAKGVFPFIKDADISSTSVQVATSWAEAEAIKSKFVDARYFMEDTPTRMLIGLSTYRFLRSLYPPSGGGRIEPITHALGAMRRDGIEVFVRDSVPAVEAVDSGKHGQYQEALYVGGEGPGNVVVPIWNDIEILVDPYSAGRKRQVAVTFFMYFGLGYRRRTLDMDDTTIGEVPGVKKIQWYETND